MKMEMILPIKPLSINAYYRNSRNGRRIKTGKGHAFDEELDYLLEDHVDTLVRFGRSFDPSKNIIKMTLDVGNSKYYIKDGSRLSMTAGDVDNYLKVTQDKIFRTMGIDDYSCRHIEVSDHFNSVDISYITLSIEHQRIEKWTM